MAGQWLAGLPKDPPQSAPVSGAQERSRPLNPEPSQSVLDSSARPGGLGALSSLSMQSPKDTETHGDSSSTVDITRLNAAQESWLSDRGSASSFFVQASPDYLTYSDATLEALAHGGDPRAMGLLATRLEARDPEAALSWYKELALSGSTVSIGSIVEMYDRTAGAAPRNPDGPRMPGTFDHNPYVAALEAVTWALVADRRGDPLGQAMAMDVAERYGVGSDGLATACDRAWQIMSAIQEARGRRGLPALEGDPPPVSAHPFQPGQLCPAWPLPEVTCVQTSVDDGTMLGSFFRCSST